MNNLAVVILAAGASTRFKSSKNKLLHEIAGKPLLNYSIETAKQLKASNIVAVLNKNAKDVQAHVKQFNVKIAIQHEALGTAHAVAAAKNFLKGFKGYVVVLNGDVPLANVQTIKNLVELTKRKNAPMGLVTAVVADPYNYGRIIRDLDGKLVKIVEENDASENEKLIKEMNAGLYCFDADWLFKNINLIKTNNVQGEYYLTDLVKLCLKQGQPMVSVFAESETEALGVNTRQDFAKISKLIRLRILNSLMSNGVSVIDPESCFVDSAVQVGNDSVIHPNVFLEGTTKIGKHCKIGIGSVIINSTIGDSVLLKPYSVLENCSVKSGSEIGPFSRLRPGAQLDQKVKVGNFVEIKKSHLKEGVKANHLTYIGDSVIGKKTNVGCGTITCNYDGRAKHKTIIGDDVFIGSDVQFVAPVKVGRGATIAAGSTITDDVPADALGIAREKQINKKNWKPKKNS